MATRVLVVDDSPTIRRVVGAALQRAGHDVRSVDSAAGASDEVAAFKPDLLLLDLSLPGAGRLGVLEQFASTHASLPPVVIMATRSDGLVGVDEHLRRLGVVDVITKPFSPEALIAVVRHSLDRPAIARRNPLTDFSDEERTVPALPRAATTILGPPTVVDATVAGEVHRPRLPAGFVLVGDLVQVPLPELLQLLKFQAHTGLLVVDTGELRFDVAIEEGTIVGIVVGGVDGTPARRGELRLGRYLVATGAIGDAALEAGAAAAPGAGLLGERLVSMGVIDREALRHAVAEQTQDFMVELLRARRGVFGLRIGAAHLPETIVRPGWSVDALLFEALRRVDEWAVIEGEVPSFDARFALRGVLDTGGLSPDELDVLQALATAPARVRDIVARSPLLPFDVCRVLYRLTVLKRVRRVDDGDPDRLLSDESPPVDPLLSLTPRRSEP